MVDQPHLVLTLLHDLRVLYLGSYTMADAEHAPTMATTIVKYEQILHDSLGANWKKAICQMDEQCLTHSRPLQRRSFGSAIDKPRLFLLPPTPDYADKALAQSAIVPYGKIQDLERPRASNAKPDTFWRQEDLAQGGNAQVQEESDYHSDPKRRSASRCQSRRMPHHLPNELRQSRRMPHHLPHHLVDEFIDEGVPAAKPRLEDTEEEILEKVLQESLTDAYPTQRGPLPPVVFRETNTGKFQPLPEVPGKGKEKVGKEQAAQVLLNLQSPKKKSPAEQYILQRRSYVPTETAGREDSTSLYAELGLYGSDTESDEEIPSVAGPNPDDVAESLPLPTPSVLAGPNLEHSDVEITDPSSQPQPEHMDEGFTAAAYPDVQENLKLTDLALADQFLNDKPSEADNEKTTADTEAESMVPDSPNVHWPFPTTTITTATTTTTTLLLPPQPQQGPSDPILIKRMGELEEFID
ncbi:hypothetical protein Tco_0961923 [Tanacetum coccineum]